jgi:hypothetical protein
VSFLQGSPESGNDSKPAPKFLDLGTCLGQDLRALYDRVPISRLYGSDVLPEFEGTGHALLKDAYRFIPEYFILGAVFPRRPSRNSCDETFESQLYSTIPPGATVRNMSDAMRS